ncbi:phosphoribosylformylglycinamidine synthase subunit PurQ [Candidatus Woesearchaeota archaeon]|nr:phosphoribosylformylglycinamidine synthase subunit PurQ [Candidatus Woesearchaeota archaeon]
MVKAYITYGQGIGCDKEAALAYRLAGAEVEKLHFSQIGELLKRIKGTQGHILNFSGGFLHGDVLGAGMCAANELMPQRDAMRAFAEEGNVIYGQCNGFQVLVKLGLLPGNEKDLQTVTLTHNIGGMYRVAPILHLPERREGKVHFAFEGITELFYLWCRHGEGKLVFYDPHGSVDLTTVSDTHERVDTRHVLLRYVTPEGKVAVAEDFPHNPNGSALGIAGLVDATGNIFGHMAHTETSIQHWQDVRHGDAMEILRRRGVRAEDRETGLEELLGIPIGLQIFRNIVQHVQRNAGE